MIELGGCEMVLDDERPAARHPQSLAQQWFALIEAHVVKDVAEERTIERAALERKGLAVEGLKRHPHGRQDAVRHVDGGDRLSRKHRRDHLGDKAAARADVEDSAVAWREQQREVLEQLDLIARFAETVQAL